MSAGGQTGMISEEKLRRDGAAVEGNSVGNKLNYV